MGYFLAGDSLFRIIGFDAQLIFDSIITGINVFILFFALSYFLFNPIQKVLKNRNEKIKSELENAKKQESDAIAFKEEYEKKLNETKAEVNRLIEEAKKDAKRSADEIIEKAKADAAVITARANKEIEQEKLKAVDQLKAQVVEISTLLASKIVKENVSVKSEEKLFEEALKEIGEASWQG